MSDVVIGNFRLGSMERLGLGHESLSQHNGRLILCAISGFGRTGPDADRPGYDLIVHGESGVMDIAGDPNGPPMKVGTSIADLVTRLYATQAVLAALCQRDRTGWAGRVDVAMLDATASLLTFGAGIYFATGRSPQRRCNGTRASAPMKPSRQLTGGSMLASPTTSSRVSSAMSSTARICVTICAFIVLRIASPIVQRWSSFSSRYYALDQSAIGRVP